METSVFMQHALLCLSVAGLAASITLYLLRRIKALDVPNERSSHTTATPRGGGIAIVVAFMAGVSSIPLIDDRTGLYTPQVMGFLLASLMIAMLSLYDDFKSISFKIRLAGQTAGIIVGLMAGLVIDSVQLPVLGEVWLGAWAYPLTLLWMLGLTNSYNFIDGLDGMAASTAVIAALFLAYISFRHSSSFIYLAALILAMAASGFLYFNWPPARIFMGDVGSTFLGFSFAAMAVMVARYDQSHVSIFVVPLLLFHFIFDTAFTFSRRLISGEHVFTAHRTHLYQLLNRFGHSHRRISLIYSAMAVCQGAAAVWMAQHPDNERIYIFLPFVLLYLTGARWITVVARQKRLIA